MRVFFLITFSLFLLANSSEAQPQIDSTLKPAEVSNFDGPLNTVFSPGFLLKTKSKNFYEITGKKSYSNKVANPEIKVYQVKKRKYVLLVKGMTEPLPAVKVQDVIESSINGDFSGWDGTTSFTLINGDVWVQDEIKSMFHHAIFRPAVYIFQADDGTYKMKVDGVAEMVRVKKK